ncbi:MAG: protein kinase [Deltaproteobacteria bacterium]
MLGSAAPGSSGETAAPSLRRKMGRYDVRYLVASGGMASVSLARLSTAEGFAKWVAIKTIHPHIATDARFVRMFLNEAMLAARIDHPNVCSVFDFGEAEGVFFLAMEYLHGESLGRVLRETGREHRPGLSVPLAARIIADAARGLHAAHELKLDDGRPAGVVHRDISPQNLFVLYSGVTKVVDFGIARSVEHAGENTSTGEIKGKLAYMAPEQIRAQPLDRRADVWALGVVLWECVAGARLFRRANDPTTMYAVLEDPIPPASTHGRDVPPEIEAIIARALSRDREQRYPTALALARDLEAWIARSGSHIGPDDVAEEMTALFRDDIAMRDELLRRPFSDDAAPVRVALEGAPEPAGPNAEPATRVERAGATDARSGERESVELPMTDEDPADIAHAQTQHALTPHVEARAPAEPRVRANSSEAESMPMPLVTPGAAAKQTTAKRSTLGIAAALVVVLLGVGGGVLVFSRTHGQTPAAPPHREPPVTATPQSTEPPPVPAPIVTPTPLEAPTPAIPVRAADAGVALPTAVTATAPATGAATVAQTTAAPTTDAGSTGAAAPALRPARRPTRPAATSDSAYDPTTAVAQDGTLTLFSPVRCEVFEGSRSLGHTPLVELRMVPGEHALRVVPDNGDPAQNITVGIDRGAGSVLHLRWE